MRIRGQQAESALSAASSRSQQASREATKVAVLISGNGSNLQALIDAAKAPDYPAQIALVISNKPGAYGLRRAREAGIEAQVLPHTEYPNREQYDDALHGLLQAHGIEIICLAGFMRLLTPGFTEKWSGRMLNIHPSLLPAFRGLHTHREALAAGVKFHGATVHFVVPEVDAGPIVIQAAVPVLPDDTEEVLAARVLAAEHQIYPYALRKLAEGKLRIESGRVLKSAQAVHEYTFFNPDIRF
jgi:phosphoribosylglycinamide formyltransferase-1